MSAIFLRPILSINKRLQFLHQHAAIEIRLAANLVFYVRGWRVLIDPVFVVVNTHDDEWLDLGGGNQSLCCFVNAPFLAGNKRGRAVEQILTVVQIKNGITSVLRRVVSWWQIDEYIAIVVEDF